MNEMEVLALKGEGEGANGSISGELEGRKGFFSVGEVRGGF